MNNNLKIKVPIYTSVFHEDHYPNQMFGGYTYREQKQLVIDKIDLYNRKPTKESFSIPNTLKKRVIDSIKYEVFNLGEIPVILLSISAYETNLNDVYVELNEKIALDKKNKVGSDHNIMILYPEIHGIDPNNFKQRWIAFIYEEPNKDKGEVVSVCKLTLNKILNIKTKNVKLPSIIDELNKMGTIQQLCIKLYAVEKNINDVDILYKTYVSDCRLKREKNTIWDNIPANKAREIIESKDTDDYSDKEVKVISGKKEYKFKESLLHEAQTDINTMAEEIFNEEITLTAEDIDSIYDTNFIIEKITPIITNYVSSYAK
jgi:hypothetical protein